MVIAKSAVCSFPRLRGELEWGITGTACAANLPPSQAQGYRIWNFRMPGVSTSRPCERRDPYAAAWRLGTMATLRTNKRRWLWVPAFVRRDDPLKFVRGRDRINAQLIQSYAIALLASGRGDLLPLAQMADLDKRNLTQIFA
jgi:hypothetical protein